MIPSRDYRAVKSQKACDSAGYVWAKAERREVDRRDTWAIWQLCKSGVGSLAALATSTHFLDHLTSLVEAWDSKNARNGRVVIIFGQVDDDGESTGDFLGLALAFARRTITALFSTFMMKSHDKSVLLHGEMPSDAHGSVASPSEFAESPMISYPPSWTR
jgi:hypothetical protein